MKEARRACVARCEHASFITRILYIFSGHCMMCVAHTVLVRSRDDLKLVLAKLRTAAHGSESEKSSNSLVGQFCNGCMSRKCVFQENVLTKSQDQLKQLTANEQAAAKVFKQMKDRSTLRRLMKPPPT
eukprot:6339938-Amphidinium_carterae.1